MFSIVVPVKDEAAIIENTLRSLDRVEDPNKLFEYYYKTPPRSVAS